MEDSFLSPLPAVYDSDTPLGSTSPTQPLGRAPAFLAKGSRGGGGGADSGGIAAKHMCSNVRQTWLRDLSQDSKPQSLSLLIC